MYGMKLNQTGSSDTLDRLRSFKIRKPIGSPRLSPASNSPIAMSTPSMEVSKTANGCLFFFQALFPGRNVLFFPITTTYKE